MWGWNIYWKREAVAIATPAHQISITAVATMRKITNLATVIKLQVGNQLEENWCAVIVSLTRKVVVLTQ